MNRDPKYHSSDVSDIARLIFSYLQNHPRASDTLEGIASWWVMNQRLSESIDIIQRALQQLEDRGLIIRSNARGGRTLYKAASGEEGSDD